MKPDRIEELLRTRPSVEPSLGFTERVMGAVRREAAQREGLRFPWRRLAGGLAACAVVTLAAFLLAPSGSTGVMPPGGGHLEAARATVWLATSLLASWFLVWWSLRVVGYSR